MPLMNSFPNGGVFLCLNGPSFDLEQRAMLAKAQHEQGITTFGVNNGEQSFRRTLWACVDDPPRESRFLYGYERNEHFRAAQWLTEGTINWGNHKCRGGGRSVMLAALKISILLGFRRIYLVGCDFFMDKDHQYFFEQERTPQAIKNNMTSYGILENLFMELTEPLADAGIGVWNCTRGSRLKVFPEWDLEAAVRVESLATGEGTGGIYEAA